MDKRGKIGDFIASVTVLFGVLAVMALFTAFSLGLFGANTIKDKLKASTTSDIKINNLGFLFEEITLNEKKMTVLEGYEKIQNGEENGEEEFKKELKRLTPRKGCSILLWSFTGENSGNADEAKGYIVNNIAETVEYVNVDMRFNLLNYSRSKIISDIPISLIANMQNEGLLDGWDDVKTYRVYRGECK